MARNISFIALLIVIGLLFILFYRVMAGFLVPLFLAALLVVIFNPLHQWMVQKCNRRLKLASLLTTATIMLSVLVPLGILFLLAAFESQQLVKQIDKNSILQAIGKTRERLNLTMPPIATDLQTVENRLDNISEMERFEDIVYLTDQLENTDLYNQGLAKKLPQVVKDSDSWKQYVELFSNLIATQRQIVAPKTNEFNIVGEMDESGSIEQPPEPAILVHEFQQTLADARQQYAKFKIEALGGNAFWVWLREMANPTPEVLQEYGTSLFGYARSFLVGLGASTTTFIGKLIFGIVIMVIALYFFLLDGPKMVDSIKSLSPIDDEHEQELIEEFSKVSRAVVVATLLAAFVQALLGGIGYYFAGLDSVFLLTLLTGCMALVPFFGAASVWVPCVLWLFFIDNQIPSAIGLGLFGIVISTSDNYIKPLVLHGQSNIHPLLALLSILGGVAALGPIGLLIGPMIVAFLQTLLKILQREMVAIETPTESPNL